MKLTAKVNGRDYRTAALLYHYLKSTKGRLGPLKVKSASMSKNIPEFDVFSTKVVKINDVTFDFELSGVRYRPLKGRKNE